MTDPVNHPSHYEDQSADGHEPIELCEQYGFCLGNAMKYLIRAGHKENTPEAQDLRKARWYLFRHLETYSREYPEDEDVVKVCAKAFGEKNPFIAALFCGEDSPYVQLPSVIATIRLINERLEELK